jgi:hypothetical protein
MTTAGATLAGAITSVPPIVLLGVNLGLRADVLVAGFAGALVAIVLLNSVPEEGDGWRSMARTAWRRMFVAAASALVAGYLTPIALHLVALPDPFTLGGAFAIGAGAQKVLRRVMDAVTPRTISEERAP